jgi:polyhydroxyalkanoate synthase
LVTALSAKQHPTLNLFLNKQSVAFVLDRAQKNGVMEGRELSHIFAWLRPVDLVWNFWVNNCLLGKEPPSMDVLFWDNDSTRLPAGLHRDFVDIVVNDRFSKPDKITIGDQQLNLQNIDSDFYFVGGEDDYLMPWKNCFRNIDLFPNASCQFVLSNSGHIQSILRPPGIAKTYYYTNTNQKINDPNQWLEHAEKHEGSWWNHWTDWLSTRSGTSTSAPTHLGSDHYPPLCASPGTYVLES